MKKRSLSVFLKISCILLLAAFTSCASSTQKKDLSDDQRASLWIQAAAGAIREGDYPGALVHLAEAEKYAPTMANIHHTRALVYYFQQNYDAALVSIKRAYELGPDDSPINNTYGKILLDVGKNQEAETVLLKAAQDPLYGEAFKARTSLGILYYRQGKLDKAKEQMDYAIRAEPVRSCVAYYYRGHLWLKEAKITKAIVDYRNATKKFCGSFAEAHLALGEALIRNRDFTQARKKFLEITQLYPDSDASIKALEKLRSLP